MKKDEKEFNSNRDEDQRLIQNFQTSDKKAFDTLVLKYKNKIFNLCYNFLGNYDDADDIAQETFVKVYYGLKNFNFQSSFSTWLYRIAVNTCKNKVSAFSYRLRKKTFDLDRPKEFFNGVVSKEIPDHHSSPESVYERKELNHYIQKAIQSLPGKQKSLVLLCDVENLSYEEIVKITGYKLGTVKSKLARARELLRKKLKGVWEE